MEAHQALGVSMLVVGTTSLAALVPHARRGRVQWRMGLFFGLAGMAGAFLAGRLTRYIPGIVLLVAFAAMMFATAFAMLRRSKGARALAEQSVISLPKIIAEGFALGAVTGLLGAGGGFVIVPALVLLAHLPIDIAVGTSLVVIAMNSAAGFIGVVGRVRIDGQVAVVISAAAVLGSAAGAALAGRIPPVVLKTSFGWLVLAMAFFILAQELPLLLGGTPSVRVALAVSLACTLVSMASRKLLSRLGPKSVAETPVTATARTLPGKS